MPPSLANIFDSFEKGQTPENKAEYDEDGHLDWILARSQRGDIVLAAHREGTTYDAIRVEPVHESQHQQMQRYMKKPHKALNPNKSLRNDRKFEKCQYQLQTKEVPLFREEQTRVSYRTVHEVFHWNQRGVTSLRTAVSRNRLQEAWTKWRTKE